MKKLNLPLWCAAFFFYCSPAAAQQNIAEAFFTSEATAAATADAVFVSVKKYNASEEEIQQAAKPKKGAPMNYLQVPFTVTNASLFNNGFESVLYCLDNSGRVKWNHSTGFSKSSAADPVVVENGYVYTGSGSKEGGKIQLQKLDKDGTLLWNKTFDSLENVNYIDVSNKTVNVLVSFEVSKKVEYPDKTFSFNTYPIYFFMQLDPLTGAVIKKEYQMMGNYLSSIGFSNPYINSYKSYYLSNKDSAIFLSTENQQSATVVSQDMPKQNKIIRLTAGPSENHYLTVADEGSHNASYELFTDFYGSGKKYSSKLDIKRGARGEDRVWLMQNENDSSITVVAKSGDIAVCYTDKSGKSDCSTKTAFTQNTPVGVGLQNGKPFLITVAGRNRPGEKGRLVLLNF
jgi:hypothetical protein